MNYKDLTLEYIQNNPGCTNDQISRALRIKYNSVKGITGDLIKSQLVTLKKKKVKNILYNSFYFTKNKKSKQPEIKKTYFSETYDTEKLNNLRKRAAICAANSEQRNKAISILRIL